MSRVRGPVAVVGAGPAGARAAELLAAGGAEVLLFDPEAPWEKPCGGGIPRHALEHFPELASLGGRGRWVRRVRVVAPEAGELAVELPAPLLLVERRALGEYQLGRARAAGAQHVARRVVEVARGPGGVGFRVVDDAGAAYDVAAVIGADGAASLVRRRLAAALRPRTTPARGRFVPVADGAESELVVVFGRGLAGYVWEFPRGETSSVGVCSLEPGWSRRELEAALAAHRSVQREAAGEVAYGHPIPLPRREDCCRPERYGGPNWAVCGDAAGLVDPITGEGIHYALRSGELAARAWLEDGTLAGYPRRLARWILPELRRAHQYAARFYAPGFTDALVRVCAARPHVRAVLADLLAGRRGYAGLRRCVLSAAVRDVGGAGAARLVYRLWRESRRPGARWGTAAPARRREADPPSGSGVRGG